MSGTSFWRSDDILEDRTMDSRVLISGRFADKLNLLSSFYL